ncbi:hypothetical protein ACXN5S_19620 [Pseudoroseicyclus sp. H15]
MAFEINRVECEDDKGNRHTVYIYSSREQRTEETTGKVISVQVQVLSQLRDGQTVLSRPDLDGFEIVGSGLILRRVR